MTLGIIHRVVFITSAAAASLAGATIVPAGISTAAWCGPGTVYDAPSDTCFVAAQPPPPHSRAYRHGDWTPGFSVCVGGGRRIIGVHACF